MSITYDSLEVASFPDNYADILMDVLAITPANLLGVKDALNHFRQLPDDQAAELIEHLADRLDDAVSSPSAQSAADRPTRFDEYEVHGVRELDGGAGKYCEQVPDAEAEFWSLFGHIPRQGLDCIGDFETREHAEEVYARITGRPYGSPS